MNFIYLFIFTFQKLFLISPLNGILGSKWGTLTIVFLAIFEGDEGMLNRI
jgi:hypothetical protein